MQLNHNRPEIAGDLISRTGNSLVLLLVIVCLASCNLSRQQYGLPAETCLADSLLLPEELVFHAHFSRILSVDSNTLVYFDQEKNLFCYFSTADNAIVDSVKPVAPGVKSFVVAGADSLYYELESDKLVACFRKRQRVYDLAPMIRSLDSNLSLTTINPIQLSHDTLVSSVRSFISDPDTLPSRRDVFNFQDVLYKIEGDSVRFIGKYNPNTERLIGQDYYSNLDRERYMVHSGAIIYAYEYSDSLLRFDFNKGCHTAHRIVTPNFTANEPFDNKKMGDMDFADRYLCAQSRLHFLRYDQDRHLFYQFLKHKGVYVSASGEKHTYYDLPYSLLVCDEELHLREELLLGEKKYWPLKAFTLKGRIYIAGHPSRQRIPGKVMFYGFRISGGKTGS